MGVINDRGLRNCYALNLLRSFDKGISGPFGRNFLVKQSREILTGGNLEVLISLMFTVSGLIIGEKV